MASAPTSAMTSEVMTARGRRAVPRARQRGGPGLQSAACPDRQYASEPGGAVVLTWLSRPKAFSQRRPASRADPGQVVVVIALCGAVEKYKSPGRFAR